MSPLINHLHELVEDGELDKALDLLLRVKQENPQLRKSVLDENTIRIWMSRHRRLRREIMEGTLSDSQKRLRENTLTRDITDTIMGIPSSIGFPRDWQSEEGGGDGPIPPAPPSEAVVNILMLTANPRGTVKLNLEREHARIHEELSAHHDTYKLNPKYDVKITELVSEIIREKPRIVHFSGHGRSSRPSEADPNDPFAEPQPGEVGGLMMVNAAGDGLVTAPAAALSFMFQSMKENQAIPLEVVLLNACHSGEQAAVIAKHIPYVIGTSDEVMDEAAWVFSKGFYFSLANQAGTQLDETAIRRAFNAGQINAVFAGEPQDRFQLYVNGEKQ